MKKVCEECNYKDESPDEQHPFVFAHHSGLYLCAECAERVEKEMYGK